jgi:hypothetical protein
MTRIRVLFVTYASVPTDSSGTSMIGVIKRCARLIAGLPRCDLEPQLLHFGPMPQHDPLLAEVLPSLEGHTIGSTNSEDALRQLYARIKPDVLVLGEGPGEGMMGTASNVAAAEGIPQICVENFYSPRQPDLFVRFSPAIDQWLLLGLPNGSPFGRISPRAVLAPPLLPEDVALPRDRAKVTILGYDPTVARVGLEFLHRLPTGTTARLIGRLPPGIEKPGTAPPASIVPPPTDAELRGFLQTSRLIICKSGFQQMVESLASGTPAIVHDAAGGVPEFWLHGSLRPFLRYFPANGDWSRVLAAAGIWLSRRPSMPWTAMIKSLRHPARVASEALEQLVHAAVVKRGSRRLR